MIKVQTFKVSNNEIKNQCYLLYDDASAILIDPAWNYQLIDEFVKKQRVKLCAVFLTHAHKDHTNLAEDFADTYNIPVYMSFIEIDYYGFDCLNLIKIFHLKKIVIHNFTIFPIITPGHTCGSVCYWVENNLFTGDTVFIEGVGICTSNGGDVNQLFDSIQFLKSYLSTDTLVWPGHSFGEKPGKTLKYLLNNNIYFQCGREHFINFRMRKTQPNPTNFQ